MFQWYFRYWLGRRSLDDKRQIARWKKNVSRFTGRLVKMIRDVNGRSDDYSISPKILQILLRWGFELVENDLLPFIFCSYKNELLFFNRQELLQKEKDKYHNYGEKEKAAEYYLKNKDA